MRGSKPGEPGVSTAVGDVSGAIELSPDDLIEVEGDRASILKAAAGAQNIAMLTGTHGVMSPPLARPRVRLPLPEEIHAGALPDPDDAELGRLRARVAARAGDSVGELRARLELARAELERDHPSASRREAEAAARACEHAPAAHAMLRSLFLGREDINEQLAHVEQLVAHAARENVRADWLCERARLLEARDGVTTESVSVWKEALALAPDHAGALYGAEVAFERTGRHAELGEVLGHLAELAKDGEPAAWMHVERAIVLDRRLGDVAGARVALTRALDLSPGIGPVRAAFVDHAVCHRDDATLAGLLEVEANLEVDPVRAARLELDAALAHLRAGSDRARCVRALEHAHARAPTSPLVDLRVAEELARLYDGDGRDTLALRARKAALKWLSDPREELVALRAIATSAERGGEIDAAVLALERARVLDADDVTLLADLDRLLSAAKRHEARAVLWMREAARVEDPAKKARALLVSAEAARAAGKDLEAAKQREAAWLTAPTAPGVYDALAEKLVPVASESAVQARVALYEQAARATKDPDRRIHLLEKVAWLKDDIAGDTAGAARVYEEILAIEPARLSAIIGLASVATRAGDLAALARALLAQADVTADIAARSELRLRAAEALATVDPERALALAEELQTEPSIRAHAAEVVTALHVRAERWDRAVESLARRGGSAAEATQKIALVLAEVDILLARLRAPERALTALSRLPRDVSGDAALRAAALAALEALGDAGRLRAELSVLADRASSPFARARLLVRAAELDEREGRDADALCAYQLALDALPDDVFLTERLRRLGARVPLGDTASRHLTPLILAVRALDHSAPSSAEPLLASGARDIATLRLAERLARQASSVPQLANALALTADAYPSGVMARRALEGLASLVSWTLPESDDIDAWDRLLALGFVDVAGIDALVRRAHRSVLGNVPAAIASSVRALRARLESCADDTERLLIHLDLARLARRAGSTADASEHCKRALAADPASLSAACMLAEIAAEVGDEEASIVASLALSEVLTDSKARAELLRDAADLSAVRGDKKRAAELLERSLQADPDGVQSAARLADLQRTRGAFADLARALRAALEGARTAQAIVPMASELAEVAKNHLRDPMLAISALERIHEVDPAHVPSLFLLAELFIAQRAWDKALSALGETAKVSNERSDKLVALVGRASIYRRILGQPALAEAELRVALELDPHDPRTIRGLLELGELIPKEERATLLGRLVVGETAPSERLGALLELAEARRAVGDVSGAEGALVEAASLSPDPAMLERVRSAVGNDTEALSRVLSKAVARAHEGGRVIDPTWLIRLGSIELDLGRTDEAIERFEEALRGDDARDDARVALARAFSSRGDHEPAFATLCPVIAAGRAPIDVGFLRLLETSLSGAGRAIEQRVARELRSVAGDLSKGDRAELDARVGNVGSAEGLSASTLRGSVMPGPLGDHPLWDVAALATVFAGKLARVGLASHGSSTRDRVKPRTSHPLRFLFDRAVKAFELGEVELAVSDSVTVPLIACEDVPWVILPGSMASLSDADALAALARPLTRIALGVPWLGPLEARDVLAILVAFGRQVAPSFASASGAGAGPGGERARRIESLVPDYAERARRAIDRKRRRLLEELEPALEGAPTMTDEVLFASAVAATEARAAFLLSGSLRAALASFAHEEPVVADVLRAPNATSLAALSEHVPTRSLVAFALQSETTALRRSLGMA